MSSQLARVVQELRGDVLAGKTIESLTAGVTSGLGLLVAQIAFATFIFSGPLAAYSSQGVGLVLFGNFAACLIMALAGGYRGVIAGLSPAMVVGMAVIGSSMDAEGEALFVTVAGALILSAVITGLSCLILGRFRLANLLRFIPYPVSAGFVAGIGGVVCLAAMSMMGAELHWSAIPELLEPSRLWRWGPGVVFGAALYIAMKRWGNALILPISVALAVVGYHIALTALGVSGDEARAAGLLLTSTTDGNLWPALGPADIKRVEWAAMATQIPNMMVLILVGFICVVMNLSGLEVAANQELDWDREFQVGGVASVFAGLGGGTIATVVVPASLRSKLLGAETSLTGISAALVVGSALFFGDGMLELVPSPLVGGMLFFAGLGMLDEGLVRSHRRLPRTEFSIIALIFVIIIAFGLLEGVGAGMVATLVFFTVRLSSVDPIESCFTACGRQSNKARPVPERAILRNEGERVLAYLLRGYIFFGSASPLADRLGKSLGGPSRPHCLLLDFAAVSGFDFSAVNVLSRLLQAAHAAGVQVVLSALPEQLQTGLERNLPPAVFAQLFVEPDADLALERCEETIIEKWKANAGQADRQRASLLEQTGDDLERYLERQIAFEALEGELRDWLEVREYAAGDAMVGPGSTRQDLQLLQAGRASAYDASGARLYQCGPGDAVLPMGVLEGSVTTVVAEETCRTMVLTPATRHRLETDRKDLAFKLYQYLLSANFQAESSVGQQQASAQAGDEDGVKLQP